MNKRLIIQLIVRPDCKLIAVDNSDYGSLGVDLLEHVMLEFLSYNDESTPVSSSVRIRKEIHNRGFYLSGFSSEFVLETDGTYSYYKLLIPTLDHFKVETSENDLESEVTYSKLFEEIFFYKGVLYKSNLPSGEEEYNLEQVLKNSDVITNYIDAYNIVQNGGGSQTFYCPIKNVFSVCKLQRCLVYLQRQLLLDNSKICSYDKCSTDENLRNRRDFLLSAMYVFDYLKDIGNFTEAQRILDNLSICNSICGDELNHFNKGCGCGNSV
jgi:hypothetical protein